MEKIKFIDIIDNGFWTVRQTFWKNKNKEGNVLTMKKSKGKNGDAVFILPITEDNEIIFIKEFKFGPEEEQFCIPAGGVDFDSLEDSVKRELEEETGYTSKNIIKIGEYNQNNYIHGKMHLFIALNCKKIKNQNLDNLEKILVYKESFDFFKELIDKNIIKCPWTNICFNFYEKNKGKLLQ